MPESRVVKWGNSLAVRIPKLVAEEAGVNAGDAIDLKAELGEIKLVPRERVPSLKELVSRITPANRHDETLAAKEVGREVVEW